MATDIGYRMTGYALTDIIFDTVLGGGGRWLTVSLATLGNSRTSKEIC